MPLQLLNIANTIFLKHSFTILLLLVFVPAVVISQLPSISVATGISILRNFKKEQRFWAVGHNTDLQFHITNTDVVYVGFIYTSNGKFSNKLQATAKSAITSPQLINYTNSGKMRAKEFSIGWKKFLKGNFNEEKKWNLYGTAGFGLLLGRIINTYSVAIDTTGYNVPVKDGKANFKRLTFDLGLGAEIPLAADFYFYLETKTWIPTTNYPSNYLFVNKDAPFVGMLSGGIRILF